MEHQGENHKTKVHIETSARWSLNWRDITKGGTVAAIMAGLTAFQQALENGGQIFNAHSGKTIAYAAIGGAVAYLLKNWGTDTKIVQVEKKQPIN